MSRLEEISRMLPERISDVLYSWKVQGEAIQYEKLQEVRLRSGQPLMLLYNHKEQVFDELTVSQKEISQCLQYISEYSLYAYQEDIRQGFITIAGGHRVGLAGQVVLENGSIKGQKHITFLNIRVAHQLCGCADKMMDFIVKDGIVKHTLVISPPACGKTTLLRDFIRQLSYGYNGITKKIGIIDERSELAACHEGIPQNDVGPRTDVLDLATKAEGMLMMLRSMSPDIIAVDEIGGQADMDAVEYLMNCGCTVFATIHGKDLDQIMRIAKVCRLIGKLGFSRIIVLSSREGTGTVESMIEI